MINYLNSQTLPLPRPPIKDFDPLQLEQHFPVPKKPLETDLVRVEPLIPSIHGERLAEEFMKGHDDPDVFFYPFPYGKPYSKSALTGISATKRETYVYLEKQRRRPNFMHFAIIDKKFGEFAGTYALGCSPDQATLDVRTMALKLFPKFRGTYILYHSTYLLLSHVLNPVSEGGCGFVRRAWCNSSANPKSARVAEKMGYTLEGPMRCYEVSDPYEGYPYEHSQVAADETDRPIEDAIIYSMTHFDSLRDGKKQHLEAVCTKWT
ncbi:hypothetical protein FRC07_004294 [Ceratobasidium sp. 392]|nr:hypothetical protein FRC07_004294 [Ceratobasidium sp. 392]